MPEPIPQCACRLHSPVGDEASWSETDRKVIEDVTRHGWHDLGVVPPPGGSAWAYSIGLWHQFQFPELAMFGLHWPDMGDWINAVGEMVRSGNPPKPGQQLDGVLTGFPLELRPVHPSWYPDLFGYGMWFYQRTFFPVLQLIWPDRNGLFPWDSGAGERCRGDQPVLWKPAEEHPLGKWRYGPQGLAWLWPDRPDKIVFLTKRIAAGESAPLLVVHEDDERGDWQFIDDGPTETDDIATAHLGDIVARFPECNELADLPRGSRAWRHSATAPWFRE